MIGILPYLIYISPIIRSSSTNRFSLFGDIGHVTIYHMLAVWYRKPFRNLGCFRNLEFGEIPWSFIPKQTIAMGLPLIDESWSIQSCLYQSCIYYTNHVHPCQSRWHHSHVLVYHQSVLNYPNLGAAIRYNGRRDPHGPGEGGACGKKHTYQQVKKTFP